MAVCYSCQILCSLEWPDMFIMCLAGISVSVQIVMAVALTQWFVYTLESQAPFEMAFIIMVESLFTPSGLFLYHIVSPGRTAGFGKTASDACAGGYILYSNVFKTCFTGPYPCSDPVFHFRGRCFHRLCTMPHSSRDQQRTD